MFLYLNLTTYLNHNRHYNLISYLHLTLSLQSLIPVNLDLWIFVAIKLTINVFHVNITWDISLISCSSLFFFSNSFLLLTRRNDDSWNGDGKSRDWEISGMNDSFHESQLNSLFEQSIVIYHHISGTNLSTTNIFSLFVLGIIFLIVNVTVFLLVANDNDNRNINYRKYLMMLQVDSTDFLFCLSISISGIFHTNRFDVISWSSNYDCELSNNLCNWIHSIQRSNDNMHGSSFLSSHSQ